MNEIRQRRIDEEYRLHDLRVKALTDRFTEFGEPAQTKTETKSATASFADLWTDLERIWADLDRVKEEENQQWRHYPKPGDQYFNGPTR